MLRVCGNSREFLKNATAASKFLFFEKATLLADMRSQNETVPTFPFRSLSLSLLLFLSLRPQLRCGGRLGVLSPGHVKILMRVFGATTPALGGGAQRNDGAKL